MAAMAGAVTSPALGSVTSLRRPRQCASSCMLPACMYSMRPPLAPAACHPQRQRRNQLIGQTLRAMAPSNGEQQQQDLAAGRHGDQRGGLAGADDRTAAAAAAPAEAHPLQGEQGEQQQQQEDDLMLLLLPWLLAAPMLALTDVGSALAADGGDSAIVGTEAIERYSGFLSPIVDRLEGVLYFFQGGLEQVHVPYAFGWSIVLLTIFVKLLTFPFTKTQVQSSLSVQQLKPQVDQIKALYPDDPEAVKRETSALYEKAGVNPSAGCLPTLLTLPIYFSLYRSLSNVSNEGLLSEGFYWVPSLAGPTTLAAQKAGAGSAWLLPLVDGAPPIGWSAAAPYLVLPVLLVVAQWVSSAILSPIDPNDKNAPTQRTIITLLPLMVGWFSLNVPSGLSLYYFANSVFTSLVQFYLKKLGGAEVSEFDLGPLELGMGRRAGPVVQQGEMLTFSDLTLAGMTDQQAQFQSLQQEAEKSSEDFAGRLAVADGDGGANPSAGPEGSAAPTTTPAAANGSSSSGSAAAGAAVGAAANAATAAAPVQISRRCKRKKLDVAAPANEAPADGAVATAS